MSRSENLNPAIIPGDGLGPELVDAAAGRIEDALLWAFACGEVESDSVGCPMQGTRATGETVSRVSEG